MKKNQRKTEFTSAQEEVAATAVMRSSRKTGFSFSFFKPLKLKLFFAVLFTVMLIGTGIFMYQKLFTGSTYASETVSIVEEVRELSSLATAEAVITTVIKEENNKIFNKDINVNFPGTKRTILLVVPATVLAGVDLQSISNESYTVDEEKKHITMTLPHAELLQEPSIQMDKVQTFSDQGIFRSDVDWEEGFDLAAVASDDIKEQAVNLGLLTKAEQSAVNALTGLFSGLGYTASIEFK
ncbi:DUF4230 domain-containing protein [Bacillus mesophilum]|uniref:DUF4230 domain-containing protein n=1 Tax=Bacillus mesophilum TaxID=1071718 RepID=A0A7V7RL08_9BACI|nr:DUF4230 domain-containing protein [Bacillus mesophilum]KAB2332411.1 DUF4230 domain-containing protein [Bacillus mesophilum]